MVLTEAQLQEVAARVRSIIRVESKGVGELPVAESLEGILSLPALKINGGVPEVVEAPVNMLQNIALDAVSDATTAAAEAASTANTAAAGADAAKSAADAATAAAGAATTAAADATGKAVAATTAADAATVKAGAATTAANTATANANAATLAATESSQAADTAAANAQSKAGYAQQQGDYAKAQGGAIDAKAETILTDAKSYVDQSVAALVASAPETLDTLQELAKALGDDPNFSTTMTNLIAEKLPTATFDTFKGKAWTSDNFNPDSKASKGNLETTNNTLDSIPYAAPHVASMHVPGLAYYSMLSMLDFGGIANQLLMRDHGGLNTVYFRGGKTKEWKEFWHADNFNPANYLPLAGGTITNTGSAAPLIVSGSTEQSCVKFTRNNSSVGGYLGLTQAYGGTFMQYADGTISPMLLVNNDTAPKFVNTAGTQYTLWHSGNFNPGGVTTRWYGTQAEYNALSAAVKADSSYEFNIYE